MKAPAALCLPLLLLFATAADADWPGFRGTNGTGISDERGLPSKWAEGQNVRWQTRLPGPGASSPIVSRDLVVVTSYSGYADGKQDKGDVAQLRRHVVGIDRKTGNVLWQAGIPALLPEVEYADKVTEHGYASSTPVTDAERIYVFFGRTGVFALDRAGKQLWHTEVGQRLHNWGSASSPVLYRNLLIVNATIESGSLVALDKTSGKEVWRAKGVAGCWSTPCLVETADRKHELVIHAPGVTLGFDPETGKELWQCESVNLVHPGSTPVARSGTVYVMAAGFEGRWCMAIRAGGRGDVTKTHVVWRQKIGGNYCSPLLVGDHLYFASGQFCCLRADNGQIVFQERLAGLGQEYASPVFADGKIFVCTRQGSTHVLAAKDRFELLAQNKFGQAGGFVASPAISRGQLFLRSGDVLYCIGDTR